jgi:hypothetical protein
MDRKKKHGELSLLGRVPFMPDSITFSVLDSWEVRAVKLVLML